MALMVVPSATASSPVVGQIESTSGPLVEGVGKIVGRNGLLDLSEGASEMQIRWASATLDVRYRDSDMIDTGIPGEPVGSQRSAGGSMREVSAGTMNLTCGMGCKVFAIASGHGDVGASATLTSPLWRVDEARVYDVGFPPGATTQTGQPDGGSKSGYWYEAAPGAYAFGSHSTFTNASALLGARPHLSGDILLALEGVVIEVTLETGESEVIDTNRRRVSNEDVDPLGTGRTYRVRSSYVLVSLEGASVASPSGTSFALVAPEPRITGDATLSAGSATGFFSVAGKRLAFEDESMRLDGALTLELGSRGAAGSSALPSGTFNAGLAGDARTIDIGGVRVHDAPADALRNTVAVSGGLAVLLVLLFIFKGSIFGAFYSRIERPQVLDNANRRRVHEFVARSEGASIADVCRELGLARAVALHHLRLLESHQFVVSKRHGRLRVFGIPGAPLSVQASRQADLPEDGVRRRLAEAIARAPGGLTQRELVDSIDVSQRLISYHVRKLESAGFVIATDDFPRKYRATAQLTVSSQGRASEAAHAKS